MILRSGGESYDFLYPYGKAAGKPFMGMRRFGARL
jgi:hypothetical protein